MTTGALSWSRCEGQRRFFGRQGWHGHPVCPMRAPGLHAVAQQGGMCKEQPQASSHARYTRYTQAWMLPNCAVTFQPCLAACRDCASWWRGRSPPRPPLPPRAAASPCPQPPPPPPLPRAATCPCPAPAAYPCLPPASAPPRCLVPPPHHPLPFAPSRPAPLLPPLRPPPLPPRRRPCRPAHAPQRRPRAPSRRGLRRPASWLFSRLGRWPGNAWVEYRFKCVKGRSTGRGAGRHHPCAESAQRQRRQRRQRWRCLLLCCVHATTDPWVVRTGREGGAAGLTTRQPQEEQSHQHWKAERPIAARRPPCLAPHRRAYTDTALLLAVSALHSATTGNMSPPRTSPHSAQRLLPKRLLMTRYSDRQRRSSAGHRGGRRAHRRAESVAGKPPRRRHARGQAGRRLGS